MFESQPIFKCPSFEPGAWRAYICKNCFLTKEQHELNSDDEDSDALAKTEKVRLKTNIKVEIPKVVVPLPKREKRKSLGNKDPCEILRLSWFLEDLEYELSPIHKLAKNGPLKSFKQLVEKDSSLFDSQDNFNQQTPLQVAIEYYQKEIATWIVDKKKTLETTDRIGRTPLHYCARYGEKLIATLLLQHHVNVNPRDSYHETPLHLAVHHKFKEIIELLLINGADVNALNTFQESALHIAARNGTLDLVKLLLGKGCNPKIRGLQGKPKDLVKKENKDLISLLVQVEEQYQPKVHFESIQLDTTNSSSVSTEKIHHLDEEVQKEPPIPEERDVSPEERKESDDEIEKDDEIDDENEKDKDIEPRKTLLEEIEEKERSFNLEIEEKEIYDELTLQGISSELQRLVHTIYDDDDSSDEKELDEGAKEEKKRNRSARNSLLFQQPPLGGKGGIVVFEQTDNPETMEVESIFEPYRNEFFKVPHDIFVTQNINYMDPEKPKEGAIIVLKRSPSKQGVEALMMNKWGYNKFLIPFAEVKRPDNKLDDEKVNYYLDRLTENGQLDFKPSYLDKRAADKGEKLLDVLSPRKRAVTKKKSSKSLLSENGWYKVTNRTFRVELLGMEVQLGGGKCYSIGVICAKAGQTDDASMFENESSSAFEEFCHIIGDKIQLKGWTGFRGGFDVSSEEGETFYSSWRGFEIMFHVAPYLSSEQRRRLIGNDKAVIYFQEESSFVPKFRGNVNCIGLVVKPTDQGKSYKIGCFAQSRVKGFSPSLPKNSISDRTQLRDLIMTTLINGIEAAYKSPPYVHIMANSWKDMINDLILKYPKKKQKKLT